MTGYPAVSAYQLGTDSTANNAWQQYLAMQQYADTLGYNQNAQTWGYTEPQNSVSGTAATSFKGAAATGNTVSSIPRAEEGKSSNHTTAALVTVGVALAGTAWWIASRGKAAGAKGFMEQMRAGFKSFGKNTGSNSQITMRTVNGENIFTIPDKAQTLRGAQITAKKDALGLAVNDGLQWTDDVARVKGFQFRIKGTDGVENLIHVKDGRVVHCANLSKGVREEGRVFTDAYNNGTLDAGFKKQIDDVLLAVRQKDPTKVPSGINLQNIVYGQEIASGSQAMYLAEPVKAGTGGLKLVRTNRFQASDDVVFQARGSNQVFDNGVTAIGGKKPDFSAWRVSEATYNPGTVQGSTGTTWPSGVKIKIQNNQPVAIVENGTTLAAGTPRFDSLKYQFGKVFDDAMKHQAQFDDVVRVIG